VAVVGAGVIGCAIARRFTLEGARTVVLERARDILDGASKGNSGILHTGFDAPPGSLEQRCVAAGYAEYLRIRERLDLALDRCGALVLAWTEAEEAALPRLMEQARANGVTDIEPLSADRIRALEPALSDRVRAGFRVPGEFLIDPWTAPQAYLAQALANGAELRRGTEVTGGAFDGKVWDLVTTTGPVRARAVINCAGLWGDRLDAALLGTAAFEIRPRKGQFLVFDKSAAALARHILLPVPSATTKGIVVCRTAWGNLLVGPTAEEQPERDRAETDRATLEMLRHRGAEILPALEGHEITAAYAGLRPATEDKDYRIAAHPDRRWITVGGIRSTGLSSALGTARHVFDLYAGFADHPAPLPDPTWPRLTPIAETQLRDWTRPGCGGIVCHCELVTRREIEAALTGPLGARSLAGLKRRTRVTMGRCQGFYCLAELARLTEGRLDPPIASDPIAADPLTQPPARPHAC
jgi:glycerol-3-phosphate dehydrogenase